MGTRPHCRRATLLDRDVHARAARGDGSALLDYRRAGNSRHVEMDSNAREARQTAKRPQAGRPSAAVSPNLPPHPLFDALRALVKRAGSLVGALGIFLVGGLIAAAVGIFLFS